jgi:membrane fusion protein, multidrug efflux system
LAGAITVPVAAVQRGPQGTFVYVVRPGRTDPAKSIAVVRPVTVAQQDDQIAVLTTGLELADVVVTSGFARLKDKSEVTVTRTEGVAPADQPKAQPAGVSQGPAAAPPGEPGSERVRSAEGESGKSERRGKRGKPQESAVQ